MTRLENLLTECQSMMLPYGASLWIALQSNNLQDYGPGYHDWNDLINKSQTNLKKNNFLVPKLDINFRNASSVFETSNCIEKDEANSNSENMQKVLGIPTMGITLNETQVKSFSFNLLINNKIQDDLDKALSHSVKELQKELPSPNDPFIILFDDTRFEMDQVSKALNSNHPQLYIHKYPKECYLCNRNMIYVVRKYQIFVVCLLIFLVIV